MEKISEEKVKKDKKLFEENDITSKKKIDVNRILYWFFSIFSFVIVLLIFTFGYWGKLQIPVANAGFMFAMIELSNILQATSICAIFLVIFGILILIKKFHLSLLFIPFFLILFKVNYSIFAIYNLTIIKEPVKFFFLTNLLFITFTYIPFLILYGIIVTFIYLEQNNKQGG